MTPQEEPRHVRAFYALCIKHGEVFREKNEQYGNAFEVYGVLGVVCELLGAVARLPQLVLWQVDHGRSNRGSLLDILMDIHNFANMAILMIEADNYDGRSNPEGEQNV